MLSTKSDVVVNVESADFVVLGSSVEYSPGVLLLISSSVVYGVEGSLLVSGKGVAVDTSLLGLDPSEIDFVPLESTTLSETILLSVVLGSIEGRTLVEDLSPEPLSSVAVTVDGRLVDSEVGSTISELSSEEIF